MLHYSDRDKCCQPCLKKAGGIKWTISVSTSSRHPVLRTGPELTSVYLWAMSSEQQASSRKAGFRIDFYSNIENLVLWASSEKIGCAVNICHGMMEYWNAGILKTRV